MAHLMLQRESVVVLRRMIVDGIQDKFLDDTVAAIINMVAFILKLVLFSCITVFCETLQSLTTKSDLMTVNKVHRQERLMYSVLKFLTIEENKPD